MKKEIRQVSEGGKTVQITIADERWYVTTEQDKDGNVTSIKEYPSVTWICNYVPKGYALMKWVADKGWDEAEQIKREAGNRGTKVHKAVSSLLLGNELKMDDKIPNSDTGEPEDITLEEWEAIMSFAEWHKEANPKTLENEVALFHEDPMFAGTADYICEIDGVRWLIDFKTSASVYLSHEVQLSAYNHALPPDLKAEKMAILQLGYKRNKIKKWKLTEVEDKYSLFQSAYSFWLDASKNVTMFQKDYPVSLSL